jgi:hypothetical protein
MAEPAAVHVVHVVDTEGPLYESVAATFERLEELFGVTGLPRDRATLDALRAGRVELGGREDEVRRLLSGHRMRYMENWALLDAMLDRVMAPAFRDAVPDSEGRGWCFTWFCLDHVGYAENPRRRTLGYHAIHDHYRARLAEQPGCRDELQWHFHPMSTYRQAHRCATSYVNSPHLYETLARRIIERGFFPGAFRAGFQAERPDSHLFLEQWIPFDLSNTAVDPRGTWTEAIDLRGGRSADWRRAPHDWTPYHPHHDDYQRPGRCRRWIGRALNLMNRFANLEPFEVDKAFAQAARGEPVLLGVASHDFRDLEPEVEHVRHLLAEARRAHPDVPVRYCTASEAFRRSLALPVDRHPPLRLRLELERAPADDVPNLTVVADQGRVFGPQPFLAIETRGGRFMHDNLDFALERGRWHYAFHADTLPLDDVRRVGVGACDAEGRAAVEVIAP